MLIRNFVPHKSLQPFIHTYYFLHAMATADGTQRIMANGRATLQFYSKQSVSYADDNRQFTCSLNVFKIQHIDLQTHKGEFEVIGVEFTPFGAYVFFNIPMSQCSGLHLSPDDLGQTELADLEQRLHDTTDADKCCRLLDTFFLQHLSTGIAENINVTRLKDVFHLVESQQVSADNILTPADLAGHACLSQKQLTRIFHEYVGLNPKTYLRLLRSHAAMLALRNKTAGQTLTEIAWQCGYYDLSHMTADFVQIHGNTPTEVLETICKQNPDSTYSQALRPQFSQMMKKFIRTQNLR